MSLFDTIRNALGIQRPLRLNPSDAPLVLSDSARARIAELDDDHGIHVTTTPSEQGFVVVAQEGPSQGPPPPGFDALPLSVADNDLQRLRGLTLDFRDGRWAIALDLVLRARETPNPDSRLYLCNRLLATGRTLYFTRAEGSPALVHRLLAIPTVEAILLRDNTVTVERTPNTPWDPIDASLDAAIREYFLLCGHEVDGSVLKTSDDPFEQEVWAVLKERVLPGIHQDGGDLDLLGIDDGVVRVSLQGACRSCPASTATLKHGIERTLREAFPGRIERVEQV
jgi:NFU1 iron-sulfur cluster scaffold homolog, mitochondrial